MRRFALKIIDKMPRFLLAAFIAIFLQSCACVTLTEKFQAGKVSFEQGDYHKAFCYLMPLAAKGNAEAAYAVGYMYFYGFGVCQDPDSGKFWMRLAAMKGYCQARAALDMIDHPCDCRCIHEPVPEPPPVVPIPERLIQPEVFDQPPQVVHHGVVSPLPVAGPPVSGGPCGPCGLQSAPPLHEMPPSGPPFVREVPPPAPPFMHETPPPAPPFVHEPSPPPPFVHPQQNLPPRISTRIPLIKKYHVGNENKSVDPPLIMPTHMAMKTPSESETMPAPTPAASDTANRFACALQLMGNYDLESMKRERDKLGLSETTTIGLTKHNNKNWYILLYGKYSSISTAKLAMANLPENVRTMQPWIKQVSDVEILAG